MYEIYQLSDKKHEYVPSFVWAIRELTDAKAIYRFLKSGKYLNSIEKKLKLLEKDDLVSAAFAIDAAKNLITNLGQMTYVNFVKGKRL